MRILIFFLLFTCFLWPKIKAQDLASMNATLWELAETNIDSALLYAPRVIEACQKKKDQIALAKAYSYYAVALDISGKTEESLDYFLKAVQIQEKANQKKDLSFTYNNLGLLYYAQYNYEKAIQYIQRSLDLDIETLDSSGAAGSLVNLGIMETYRNNWKKSLEHYNRAEPIYAELKDSMGLQSVLANRAKISFTQKDYQSTLRDLLLAEKYLNRSGHPIRQATNSISLSNTYREMGDLEKSLHYAQLSLAQSRLAGSREREQFAYQTLYEIYERKKDYANAFRYLRSYSQLRDSLLNEDRNNSLAEMQVKYETEKKDRLLSEEKLSKEKVQREKLDLELQAEREKKARLILLTVLVFLGLLLVAIFRAYRNKQILTQLLEDKNHLIQQNLEQKVLMIGEIHHRVRNNLTLAGSLLEMRARSLPDNDARNTLMESRQRIQSMALLHTYLYSDQEKYGIPMKSYLEKLVKGIRESGGFIFDDVVITVESDTTLLDPDSAIPIGLLVTELLINAGKYAFDKHQPDKRIIVSFFYHLGGLDLSVEDNGKGFDQDTSRKSFGSDLINGLARQLRSEWDIQSEKGTKYNFRITNFKLHEG